MVDNSYIIRFASILPDLHFTRLTCKCVIFLRSGFGSGRGHTFRTPCACSSSNSGPYFVSVILFWCHQNSTMNFPINSQWLKRKNSLNWLPHTLGSEYRCVLLQASPNHVYLTFSVSKKTQASRRRPLRERWGPWSVMLVIGTFRYRLTERCRWCRGSYMPRSGGHWGSSR